jgi:ribosomal protein L37E
MHNQTHVCAACGYPAAKIRKCRLTRYPDEADEEEHQG